MRNTFVIWLVFQVVAASAVSLRGQIAATQTVPPESASSNVRTTEQWIQRLIEKGVSRSATFREVVASLNGSDVIVYVTRRHMPEGFRGYLLNQVLESNGYRYLRIGIGPARDDASTIAVIAHELQHAREVARAPEVGRSRRIEQFFEDIADRRCGAATGSGGKCFETAAAIGVQETVLRELR